MSDALAQRTRETYQRGDLIIEKDLGGEEGDEEREIEIVVRQGDVTLRLNDLLPEGTPMIQKLRPGARYEPDGPVVVPDQPMYITDSPGNLYRPTENSLLTRQEITPDVAVETHRFVLMQGSMLATLHEIGHARSHNDPAAGPERRENYAKYKQIHQQKQGQDLTEEEMAGYVEWVIGEERAAWLFALRTYREQLSRGLNLEPEMAGLDIVRFIEEALGSYHS